MVRDNVAITGLAQTATLGIFSLRNKTVVQGLFDVLLLTSGSPEYFPKLLEQMPAGFSHKKMSLSSEADTC